MNWKTRGKRNHRPHLWTMTTSRLPLLYQYHHLCILMLHVCECVVWFVLEEGECCVWYKKPTKTKKVFAQSYCRSKIFTRLLPNHCIVTIFIFHVASICLCCIPRSRVNVANTCRVALLRCCVCIIHACVCIVWTNSS